MARAVLPLFALLLLASCATTQVSRLARPALPPSPSAGTSTITVSPVATLAQPIGLTVNSNPPGAQVYLNDVYIGDTPLTYTAFQAGTYKMRIAKLGYYNNERWVTLDPTKATTVDAQLQPKIGYILVNGVSPGAQILIDGLPARAGVNQVQTGTHLVAVSLFGYESWQKSVAVQNGQTAEVSPSLRPAPFAITNLVASRRILGPLNPGPLGRVDFSFDVSGPGSGSLVVRDPQGKVIYHRSLPPFAKRAQTAGWRGEADASGIAPDGVYLATVEGEGAKGGAAASAQTSVIVSRAAVISYRSLWSGSSGLLFAPTPELLPLGSFQVSSFVAGSANTYGTFFPIQLGFRIVPVEPLEIDAQTSVFAESSTSLPFSAGVTAKLAYLRPEIAEGFSAAVTLGGSYLSGVAGDPMTNYTGVSLGLPVEYRIGPFGALLDPQILLAPYAPYYGSSPPGVAWTGWGYGRAGLFADLGSLVIGASAALRSAPFSGGLALADDPFAGGLEIHWLLPHSQVVLSGALGGEITASQGFSLLAGAGVGILN